MKHLFRKTTALLLTLCMIIGMTGLPITAYAEGLDSGGGDAAIVAADKDALAVGFADGDSAGGVTGDLILVTTGASGSSIAWLSDTPEVIASDGTVTRPAADAEDAEVTLTATITCGEAEDTREFTVTVLKEEGLYMLMGPLSELDWGPGDGLTADTAYQVSSAEHLAAIPEKDLTAYYVQTTDIDLDEAGYTDWTPIGTDSASFTGTYDGGEFAIFNLTINDDTLGYVGLFGYVGSAGVLRNITVQNGSVRSTKRWISAGGLTGVLEGRMIDCAYSGSVNGVESSAGGLIGVAYSNAEVTGSFSSGLVNSSGDNDSLVGGIIGYNFSGALRNCYSTASISCDGGDLSSVGGLIGQSDGGSVVNCYSTGSAAGGAGATAGGLIGENSGTSVTNSYYLDTATASSAGGTALTAAQMKRQDRFTGWNFGGVWLIVEGHGTPVLAWQVSFAGGDGSEGAPYRVETALQLNKVRGYLGDPDVHFEQTNDITLPTVATGESNWTPIGDTVDRFTGIYNGNGYTIANLTIDDWGQNYVGLFGYVGTGGTLENIRITGVNISSTTWGAYVGGVTGMNLGTVTNSSIEGSVAGGSGSDTGGLVGDNYGTVSNSYTSGSVSAGASSAVGGMIGNGGGVITYNYSAANVTGGNNANVGGLFGRSYVSTSDNYSTGTITGGDNARVGGLIGDVDDGTVTNSYSTGIASGGTGASLGGLIGGGNATVNDSYYLDTAGASAGGTPLTAAQMKQWGSFEGWDFDAVWYLSENIASPALRWQLLDVIYHANYAGGEAPVHTQRIAGEAFTTAAANAFTAPSGKQFKHWNTEPGGTGTVYAAGAAVTMPAEPLNLYAIWENKSGGGGSSSDSNITVPPAKKPDQPLIAAIPITATARTDGGADASITDEAVTGAIKRAQDEAKRRTETRNGIAVSLDVTMPEGASSLSLTLSQTALQSLTRANVQSFEVNSGIASLSLDLEALKEIQAQSTGSLTISIQPVSSLSAAAKKLIGTRRAYDVTISHLRDRMVKKIATLGKGSAILSIPYAPGKNEAIGWLFGVYVDDNGNATRVPGSAYDANSRSIILSGNHFSIYGVGYTAPTEKYTDIATHWAKESIDYVVGRGLFSGSTDTAFSPNTAMDRGMLVTVLGRLAGADVSAYKTSSFSDVAAGKYYLPYVEWAYKKGIISGIGGGKFAPERAVTREEIALILQNYAKATGYTLPVTREAITFADNSSIASAYANAIRAIQQAGIMVGGSGNKFNPQAGATRAEVAAMLHRYVKLTIDPAIAQGWALNDDGRYMYYQDGKPLIGWQTIDGVRYHFYSTGVLQTGWVKDGNNWRFYSGNRALVGWWDIGSENSKKRYYFDTNAVIVSGKWLQIDGKRYYFYADGSLARGTKIDGYEVDENGVRKTE